MIARPLLLCAVVSLTACGKTEKDTSGGPTDGKSAAGSPSGGGTSAARDHKATAAFSADEAGAKALLTKIIESETDRVSINLALRPSASDYSAAFEGDAAATVKAYYEERWKEAPDVVVAPQPGQTQLMLYQATTDDLRAQNDKSKEFPGGYNKVAEKLQKGLTFYRWKFVKPGETSGMAYDGLTHVNGHWVIFPKPWKALEPAAPQPPPSP